jgi:hypothetical protein
MAHQCAPSFGVINRMIVIPSGVDNGAAGEAATWTGRPKAERTGSERIKSRGIALRELRGMSSAFA